MTAMAALQASTMKAIVRDTYGPPDVLEVREIEKPELMDEGVLVRVRAASVARGDWYSLMGLYVGRPEMGLRRPKSRLIGADFAGTVEAVGRDVTDVRPGDEVFGARTGACAEYVCARARSVALKPAHVTFEEAAAVPTSALTALQGLRDRGQLQPGQKVLINGASGGVGTFAVQIAKALGADVTAVCSTRNVDLVQSLGADYVIDYTREDFTQARQRYDIIFDNVGNHSIAERRRIMTPNGICVLAGMGSAGKHEGQWPRLLGNLKAFFVSPFISQNFKFFIAKLLK